MPSDCCSVRISRRISWRSCASRFDSGSSIRQTLVSAMIARPSATRCCWPPESCEGFRSSSAVRPSSCATRASRWSKLGRGFLSHLDPEQDVLAHAEMREQRVRLEHHRDAPLGRSETGDVAAVDHDPAFRRRVESGDHAQRRRLAAARGPEQDHQLARRGGEARPVDRPGAAPMLADAFEAERAHAIVRERRRPGCIALVSVPCGAPGSRENPSGGPAALSRSTWRRRPSAGPPRRAARC